MKAEFFGVAPLLQVYDMAIAVRFYCDLLGFELVNQSREGEEFDWCLLGVRVEPPRVAPYGMRQLYFSDPDGYGICFQWPADER